MCYDQAKTCRKVESLISRIQDNKSQALVASSHNLFSTTAYFRPPKTLPYKNFDTLNFAAVGISLFSARIALLGSVFLLSV